MSKNLFKKQILFPFLILIIIGAFLRIYKLSFQSYWYDEAVTVIRVLDSDFFHSLKTGFGVGDPPLYEFILHFWEKLFGSNEVSSRGFSSILSIATIPLMYLTVKEFFDNKTAIFSIILVTFSAYHIYYAQEARMYTFSWFFVIASNLFFIKSIKKGNKRNWIIYLITTTFAFYAHYSSLFVLFVQNIFVFTFWKKYEIKLIHWIGIQAAVIILFLPWFWASVIPYLIIPAFVVKTSYLFIIRPSYETIFETFIFFIWGNNWIVKGYESRYIFFYKVFLFLIGVMIFFSTWATFRQKKSFHKKEAVFFMLLWCFLPISILYLVSIFMKPCYLVRYLGLSLFPVYILIAYSLDKVRIKFLKIFVLTVFLIPNMFTLYRYYNFPFKGEAREITQYIKSKKAIRDTILIYHLNGEASAVRYYYPDIYYVHYLSPHTLKEIAEKNDNFWLLMPFHYVKSPYAILKDNGSGEDFPNIYDISEKKELRATKAFYFKRRDGT